MSQTQMQGRTGALPPYEYGPPDGRQTDSRQLDGPRRRRPVWPWVTAAVVLILIGSGFYAYQTISGQGTGVSVPANLIGLKYQDADSEIVHAQLTVKNVPVPLPSDGTGTADDVKSTNPSPGTQVSKGSQVTVYYYQPPGSKQIPKVAGLSVTQAKAVLRQQGFTNITVGVNPVLSATIKPGHVVKTDPPYGQSAKTNQLITLITAAQGVAVPDVTSESLAMAENTLLGDHLVYTVMKQPGPGGTSPGVVWQTSPTANTVLAPGSTVTLYVQPSSSPSPTPTTSSPSPTQSPTASPTS